MTRRIRGVRRKYARETRGCVRRRGERKWGAVAEGGGNKESERAVAEGWRESAERHGKIVAEVWCNTRGDAYT